MIDVSFCSWLSSNVSGGFSVQQSKVDFDKTIPFVFFRRASTIQERLMSGVLTDNFETTIDVEVVSTDIDEMESEADSLKTLLQQISPCSLLGNTFTFAIEVMEHSDEYISRVILDSDEGLHLATFSVVIFHRA